jgi:hypothetical protein
MMFPEGTFKNASNKVMTKALFLETSYHDPKHCVFTFKDYDYDYNGKTYYSLSKLFISMVPKDPTEYDFAITVFNSWDTWELIKNSSFVNKDYRRWRAEADVKIKSEAIKSIAEEMSSGGRSSFSAAKLLLDRGWLEKEETSQAKRKLKQKEEEDLNKQALSLLSEDAERLGIKIQ